MSGFELIVPYLMAAGTATSVVGTVASGVAADRRAQQDALNMEAQGKEEFAAAQREATAKRREGALVNSRAQALAAASGAGAGTDAPTIVKLMTDTAGEAEFNAQTSLYAGRSRRLGLRQGAMARRAEGKSSLLGSIASGFGTAAKGASEVAPWFAPASADPWKGMR